MDKRTMKKKLQLALIRELWQNQKNEFGERRQEIVLAYMDIYDPSEATKTRFSNLITELLTREIEKQK
jgi:hypothetical protein